MVFMMASNPEKNKNGMSSLSSLRSFNEYVCIYTYIHTYI
jgi:hypothetical protein